VLWSPNTQLHYPFQNTAKDYSGNGRDGTVNGSGVYATKPGGGRCLYFDGVGDYVATPSFGLSGTVVVFAADVRYKYNPVATQTFLGDNAANSSIGYLFCYSSILSAYSLRWRYAEGTSDAVYAEASNYFAAPYNDVWLHMLIACDYAGKKTYFYRNGLPLGSPVDMTGTPVFPSASRVKRLGDYVNLTFLTDGYLANVQLWTLATMPAAAPMLANAKRIMLGMNPIW
jgi:hypothetical protein